MPVRAPRSTVTTVVAVRSLALLSLCMTAAGCLGPTREPVELHGRGVEVLDETPPAGAQMFERPTWLVGDRFIMRRGNRGLQSFRVDSIDDSKITVRSEDDQVERILDLDLGELGWQLGKDYDPVEFDPVDKRFSWPLWVGKRWTSHFVKKRPGDALPILARYHCDAVERVTVPAGTFDALRVWRFSRPAVDGDFEERVDLFWYAPEIGRVVRKLQDATMTELVSLERADPNDA